MESPLSVGSSMRVSDMAQESSQPAGRQKRIASIAGAIGAVFLAALLIGWAADGSARDRVARGVTVAGSDVAKLNRAGLVKRLGELQSTFGATSVEVVSNTRSAQTTAADIGVALDVDRTAEAALRLRKDSPLLLRPFRWVGSFFSSASAPVSFSVDNASATRSLRTLSPALRVEPSEPSITFANDRLSAVPGKDGSEPDPERLFNELGAARPAGATLRVDAGARPVKPKFSLAEANSLAERINEATSRDLTAQVAGSKRPLDGAALRRLVRPIMTPGSELSFYLDAEGVNELVAKAFSDVATAPEPPSLTISGGRVQIVSGTLGKVCCADDSPALLAKALANGTTATLNMRAAEPTRTPEDLAKLGIRELVTEFTTAHPCCAPRVQNIHHMADIVRGTIIEPGATFSLNGTVGRRTAANGFVSAPTINGDGNFVDDFGGGVSQFSTTLFNAAFFGGLDIPEYMSHGLYISRYPYGREATLSYPAPDLRIYNGTPYGVLIWPTYSDTEITVGLYSTKYVNGDQIGQSESIVGKVCTGVTTVRKRTWSNGETATDRFYAEYAPAEGVQCDGSKRDKDGKEITTTTTSTTPVPSSSTTTTNGSKPGPSTTGSTTSTSSTTTTTAPPSSTSTSTTTTTTTLATKAAVTSG